MRNTVTQTVKTYFVGPKQAVNWLASQTSGIEHLEFAGQSACPASACDEIMQLQPHAVIHATDRYEGNDYLLLQNIRSKLPATYYIVAGNSINLTFRIRYLSAGANVVLNLQFEMTKIRSLLRTFISRHKPIGSPGHELQLMPVNLQNKPDLNKYFSLMDSYQESLMFADRHLALRHINSSALSMFSCLGTFLPDTLDRLVGQPISVFHRQRSVAAKVVSDPRNLPYTTQIIIGPKTLGLQVNSVHCEGRESRAGVLAQWTELANII